jgi:hypothetical protein
MKLYLQIPVLLCLVSTLGLAESWSGILVDSKCYDSAVRNVNPWDPYGDQAMNVRLCRPTLRTKSFAIVQQDWVRLKLDSSANEQAVDLVQKTNKKSYLGVLVTGEKDKDTIKVETISAASSR